MAKLSIRGLSLTLGLFWGIGNFIVGIMAIYGWGQAYVNTLGSLYIGFAPTWPGAFVGLGWAFVDGLVGGAIFAWLYNKISSL